MRPTSTRLTLPAITPRRAAWIADATKPAGRLASGGAWRAIEPAWARRWFVVDGHRVDSTARAPVFPRRVRPPPSRRGRLRRVNHAMGYGQGTATNHGWVTVRETLGLGARRPEAAP
jgi:hypothetical protein